MSTLTTILTYAAGQGRQWTAEDLSLQWDSWLSFLTEGEPELMPEWEPILPLAYKLRRELEAV